MNDKKSFFCTKDPRKKSYRCKIEDNKFDEITQSINPLITKSSKKHAKIRRKRISGVRIQITEEGLQNLKTQLKSAIPIQRLSGILREYDIEDDFFQYIKQIVTTALKSEKTEIRIPMTKMGSFITNWQNIIYRGYVISESDFNKLKLLFSPENPISHKLVYGRGNFEVVKLVRNEDHAELVGTFIMRGSIRTDRNDG